MKLSGFGGDELAAPGGDLGGSILMCLGEVGGVVAWCLESADLDHGTLNRDGRRDFFSQDQCVAGPGIDDRLLPD